MIKNNYSVSKYYPGFVKKAITFTIDDGNYPLDKKLFGVFEHKLDHKHSILFRGFDDTFMVPHSRHTAINRDDIEKVADIKVAYAPEQFAGEGIVVKRGKKNFRKVVK